MRAALDRTSSEDGAQPASHQPLKKWSNAAGFRRTLGAEGRRLSPRFVNYLTASDDDVYKLSCSRHLEDGDNGVEKVVSADLLVAKELTEEKSQGEADTALMAPPPPPPLSEERGVDVGRAGGWANSFEKLIDDPIGLHTFAEFLKKEFSAENIYFWVACERYRVTPNDGTKNPDGKGLSRRAAMAHDIFQRHLCLGAPEAVNVDSHARQETEEGLAAAEPTLFLQAQKQIFNLMKFDSYPRFLKSDLYKECLMRDMSGQSLSFGSNTTLDSNLCLHPNHDGDDEVLIGKLKKSRSDAEERRRKSLLPWHRKNRSKSKDRGETDYQKMRAAAAVVAAAQALLPNGRGDDASSSRSDLASSRSSLASSDLALIQRGALARQSLTSSEWSAERVGSEGPSVACPLCRVILPDGATTVVNTDTSRSSSNSQQSSQQTIRDLVTRLLEKRGLKYSAFEVFFCDNTNDISGKPLDLDEDIHVLGSREVRVERRVIFRVDLPSRKTIGVKSNPDRSLAQVLRPILHKYGYPMESVALCLMSENEVLDPSMPVTTADNEKIQVLTKSGEVWKTDNGLKGVNKADGRRQAVQGAPTLDEITNRVFEELLAGKVAEEKAGASSRLCNDEIVSTSEDIASVRSEDWSSEHSSGIFGRFLRSDSAVMDKSRDSRCIKGKKGSMKKMKPSSSNDGMCSGSGSGGLPAVIRAIGNDFSVGSRIIPPAPRLKVGIRPPGRSDSDELYEGLKRAQRSRLEDQRGTEINFELPDFLKDKENAPQNTKKSRKVRREDERRFTFEPVDLGPKSSGSAAPITSSAAFVSRLLDCSYNADGIIPTPRQAERYFSGKSSAFPRCVSLPTAESSCREYATDADKSFDSLNITVVPIKSDSEESQPETAKDSPSKIGGKIEKEVDFNESVSSPQLPDSSTSIECQNKEEISNSGKCQPPLPKLDSAIGLAPLQPPPPPRNNCDPPPLPPKPKNLPVSVPASTTSNSKGQPLLRSTPVCKGWGTVNSTFCHSSGDEGSNLDNLTSEKSVLLAQETVLASKRDPRVCRSRRAVYLDQPSSSFV